MTEHNTSPALTCIARAWSRESGPGVSEGPWYADKLLILLLIGLAVMFGQTFFTLLTVGLWTNPAFSHGPIVLMVALYLMGKRWNELSRSERYAPSPKLGMAFLVVSVALLVAGRDLGIIYVELGAFIFALTGIIAMVAGLTFLRGMKFSIFFMIFMIPLPGFIADPVSQWLKLSVSNATVAILGELRYPMARSGVIIQIGQYQLLVADACAGLRTLFMLETLGILYLHLVRYPLLLRNILLPILIVPISYVANLVRVIILALVTYYFGDASGQGYLHWLAGIVLFLVGLTMLVLTDALLRLPGGHARSN